MNRVNDERKILLLSSVFPPSWGAGVHRVSKVFKYLPSFGYSPIVITTREDSYGTLDSSLEVLTTQGVIWRLNFLHGHLLRKRQAEKRPGKTREDERVAGRIQKLLRRFLGSVYRALSIPDDRVAWVPFAVWKGFWIIRSQKIGILWSSSPHASCHLAALILRRLTKIPWIADFRDPMTENPFTGKQNRLHRWVEALLERQIVQHASKVTVISEPFKRNLLRSYPETESERYAVIENSFDPDDFKNFEGAACSRGKLIISHAGTFYGKRSPQKFLLAVRRVLERNRGLTPKFRVLFVGGPPEDSESRELIGEMKEVIKVIPFAPYKKMLRILRRSHLLLLIPGPGEGTITGKVFDYLALKKPMLVLSENNEALEQLLRNMKCAHILRNDDIEGISNLITLLLTADDLQRAVFGQSDEGEITRFTSIEMTRKFVSLMEQIIAV
jgi:hypothetical protein